MEEVDKIIIDSLRNINCDLPDEICSLKEFDPDTVLRAFSTCLEIINTQIKLPKKLPVSLSARINVASNVAQQIKESGFKGDMGYQTILYCNEIEVRRVLMFLIERLPKETSQVISFDQTGYVAKIIKQIEDSIRNSLNSIRTTSQIGTTALRSVNLISPTERTADEHSKLIPLVTDQCNNPTELISSLLFPPSNYLVNSDEWKKESYQLAQIDTDLTIDTEKIENLTSTSSGIVQNESDIEKMKMHLEEKKAWFLILQKDVKQNEEKLKNIKKENIENQQKLKDSVAKVKIKNKTHAILSSEENKEKLKLSVNKLENRLKELAEQWHEIEQPLLEECNQLKNSVTSVKMEYQKEFDKHQNLKTTYEDMVKNYKEKCILEQNLIDKCKELNRKNNRAAYTKRILEIVGNIKKQNREIDKVLSDTKLVQKDIHNLTGQIDRSFTLSDELIFSDCKKDESARKAYKLLAALREECNQILDAVSDLGQIERDQRNLEEQIEMEKSKDMKVKLDKVLNDLSEINQEIKLLNG